MAAFSLFVSLLALSSLGFVSSTSLPRPSLCPKEFDFFLFGIRSQCPFSVVPSSSLLQVDGNYLDKTLTTCKKIGYTTVLFYASWCPFSLRLLHTVESLSLLFPQTEHLVCNLLHYHIHSFPSILLVNGTSRIRYRGQKDILSLVRFYSRITGLKSIPYYDKDELLAIESVGKPMIQLPKTSSPNNVWKNEPLLIFSFVFICLRIAVIKLPHVLYHLSNLLRSSIPHLNLEIFGETRKLVERILHMVDIRRVWAKLRLYKTKKLSQGSKERTSLASVSLGESFSRST